MLVNLIKSQKGSASLFTILAAAGASVFLVTNMNTIVDALSGKRKNYHMNYSAEKFTRGVLNYTVYALKERWCMDNSWGRDKSCGGTEMKQVVLNPLNLERLLWSNVAADAIAESYKNTYKVDIHRSPQLMKIEKKVPISSLAVLGVNHPLNLILTPKIKRCMDSFTVKIGRYLVSGNLPKGDEKSLFIKITGKMKKLTTSGCGDFVGDPALESEVTFFPRTLNQFAVIKAGDLNIANFTGSPASKGVKFFGKTYVENDVYVPAKGFYPVGFYDDVRIGSGNIISEGKLFSPRSYGGQSNQLNGQLTTFNGFNGGVTLEAELDKGLAPLFGQGYKYPKNSLMDICIVRRKMMENPFLTRDSRLFIKGSNGDYELALSAKNEFREILNFWEEDKDAIRVVKEEGNKEYLARLDVHYAPYNLHVPPVMKIDVGINDRKNVNNELLMGRNTELEIALADVSFFKKIKEDVDIDDSSYLDKEKIDFDALKDPYLFEKHYNELKRHCENMITEGERKTTTAEYYHEACRKVIDSFSQTGVSNCQYGVEETSKEKKKEIVKVIDKDGNEIEQEVEVFVEIPKTVEKTDTRCENAVSMVDNEWKLFKASQDDLVRDVGELVDATPAIVMKTQDKLANKLDFKLHMKNESSLNNKLLNNVVNRIYLDFVAFDFAVENTNNYRTGKRTDWDHLPGPNRRKWEYGRYNQIYYDIARREFRTLDSEEIDKKIQGLPYALLRKDDSKRNEPPQVWNGSYKGTLYPIDGITTARAKEVDEQCKGFYGVPSSEWDVSFTKNTKFSWLYSVTHSGVTIEDPKLVEPVPMHTFDEKDMDPYLYNGVPTKSIVEKCIVPNNIDFVFGNYVCQELIIESRRSELNIIGTIILQKLTIAPNARNSGVNFYSIWHPHAIRLLREKKHLRRESRPMGKDQCEFSDDEPGWSPFLNNNVQADYLSCSPMKFVIHGSNNFNWTTVDPEIGIPSTGSAVTTRSKIPNRYRRFSSKVIWVKTGTL